MPKIRTMSAGRAGATAYNTNVNANTGGGNKKQGLTTTTNKSVQFVSDAIKNRAYGENRDFVFCVNQLGGIGGKSKMFATTADGVKDCITGPYGCEQIVREAYLEALNREPDQGGLRTYCLAMKKRGFTKNDVIADILQSDEAKNLYKTEYIITHTVTGANLEMLTPQQQSDLKTTVANEYAQANNISPSNVSVVLLSGSVKVRVSLKLNPDVNFVPKELVIAEKILEKVAAATTTNPNVGNLTIQSSITKIDAKTPLSNLKEQVIDQTNVNDAIARIPVPTIEVKNETIQFGNDYTIGNGVTIKDATSLRLISITPDSFSNIGGIGEEITKPPVGVYDLDYQARNKFGKTANKVLTLTVQDSIHPIISTSTAPNVDENSNVIYTIQASDLATPITYTIEDGDSDILNCDQNTGVVSLKDGALTDVDGDSHKNTYTFKAIATDKHDNSTEENITVTIKNINDNSPVFTSDTIFSVDENQTTVGTVTATDADGGGVTFYLSGTDSASFTLDKDTGDLEFKTAPDHEIKTSYSITVRADDGVRSTDQDITVFVTNVNETPTFTSSATFNVDENQTTIGTVKATDPEGTSLNYQISGSEIQIDSSSGVLTFIGGAPDYENPGSVTDSNTYTATVTVSDVSGNASSQDITVNVLDVNDAPTITSSPIFSVIAGQTSVGTITANDAEGHAFLFELGGTHKEIFNLNQNTGLLEFKTAPEYTATPYSIDVGVYDGNDNDISTTQNLTVYVLEGKVNIFGQDVTLNAHGRGFLSQTFSLTFDLTDSYVHEYSALTGWTGTTGMAAVWKTLFSAPLQVYAQTSFQKGVSELTDDEIATGVKNILIASYTTGDYTGNTTVLSSPSLNEMILPYIDPEHYLLEINLPNEIKPKKYNRTNQTSSDVDVDDVEWRLSYCNTPGDSSTIIHTFISGTQTTLQNGDIRLDVATHVTNAGKDADTRGVIWYPIPPACSTHPNDVGYVTGSVLKNTTSQNVDPIFTVM